MEIDSFLTSHERRTRPIQAYGNCFFRVISEALYYGQQADHDEIRNTLVHFISSNKDVFVKFIPSTAESFDKHLCNRGIRGLPTWRYLLPLAFSKFPYHVQKCVHKQGHTYISIID